MTDYSADGAIPVEDAAVDDPPTVDEVLDRQRHEYPAQAATSMSHLPGGAESGGVPAGGDSAGSDSAGGDPAGDEPGGGDNGGA